MADVEILNSVINTIDHNTKKPEQFLSIQNEVAVDFKNSLKRLYDFTKLETQRNTNALPELITEGFDEEQIWQQIELQNESELDYLIDGVSKSLAENKKLTISITKPKSVYNSEENLSEKEKKIVEEETSDDDDDDDEEFKSNLKKQKKDVRKRKKKSSIVDDKFFKLEELDEYLTKEEKKEKQNEKNEEKSDDEFVDLFNDFSDNDNKTEEAKLLKYADFFDSPESEDENLDNSIQHKETNDEEELEENELDDNELLESLDSDSNNEIDVDNEMEEKSSSKKKKSYI